MKFGAFILFLLGMLSMIRGAELLHEQKTLFDKFCVLCMILCCTLTMGYGGGYLASL